MNFRKKELIEGWDQKDLLEMSYKNLKIIVCNNTKLKLQIKISSLVLLYFLHFELNLYFYRAYYR